MGKTIRWSMKDPAGCVQRGQMPLCQLPGILRDFENSAAETLRRTGADHVLYGFKDKLIRWNSDKLIGMESISKEEIDLRKVVKRMRGARPWHPLLQTLRKELEG